MADTTENRGVGGRVRRASVSLMNANPQLGMWQASGLVLARAPTISELRDSESGGDNIMFDAQGHSIRTAVQEDDGELTLARTNTTMLKKSPTVIETKSDHHHRSLHQLSHDMMEKRRALKEKHKQQMKEKWGPTIMHGLKAFWRFFLTPSGFLITIYAVNVVVS
jgi:hypothetical protein